MMPNNLSDGQKVIQDMTVIEHRITFGASDILKVRVICPRCKGEIAYLLDSLGPEFNSRCIDCCPICNRDGLERADIEVVEKAFRALRDVHRMSSRKSYEPTLELSFEIAADPKMFAG